MRTNLIKVSVVVSALAFALGASAHEFECDKVVGVLADDAVVTTMGLPAFAEPPAPVLELHTYPAVVGFLTVLRNTATATSILTDSEDTIAVLAPASLTVNVLDPIPDDTAFAIGEERATMVTFHVESYDQCLAIAAAYSTADGLPNATNRIENRFVALHHVGETECRAQIVCAPEEAVGEWTGIRQFSRPADASYPPWSEQPYAVQVDALGNVYVGGTSNFSDGAIGSLAFVVKYDATGSMLWRMDDQGFLPYTVATAVTVARNGDVYLAGFSWVRSVPELSDAFVAKLDPSGAEQWRAWIATPAYDVAAGIVVDDDGGVYVTGTTAGSLDGVTPPAPDGVYPTTAFVTKLDAAGRVEWTHQFGSPDGTDAVALARDASGDLFVAGSTSGALPGNTSLGTSDAYVARLDALGVPRQFWQVGTSHFDETVSFALAPTGDMYVGMRSLLGSPSSSWSVWKLDGAGAVQWNRGIGAPGETTVAGLAADELGDVYVTGETNASLPGNTTFGGVDAFVAKLDAAGVPAWSPEVRQFGTASYDGGVAVASGGGGVFVVGMTSGPLGGPASPNPDAFIAKFDANGNLQ